MVLSQEDVRTFRGWFWAALNKKAFFPLSLPDWALISDDQSDWWRWSDFARSQDEPMIRVLTRRGVLSLDDFSRLREHAKKHCTWAPIKKLEEHLSPKPDNLHEYVSLATFAHGWFNKAAARLAQDVMGSIGFLNKASLQLRLRQQAGWGWSGGAGPGSEPLNPDLEDRVWFLLRLALGGDHGFGHDLQRSMLDLEKVSNSVPRITECFSALLVAGFKLPDAVLVFLGSAPKLSVAEDAGRYRMHDAYDPVSQKQRLGPDGV